MLERERERERLYYKSLMLLYRLMEPKGDTVPQRDFHNAECVDECIVVFGGRCTLSNARGSSKKINT